MSEQLENTQLQDSLKNGLSESMLQETESGGKVVLPNGTALGCTFNVDLVKFIKLKFYKII